MGHSEISIEKGSVFAYRVFDLGNEIDLKKADSLLRSQGEVSTFDLRTFSRSLMISTPPLALSLEPWKEKIQGCQWDVVPSIKIWSFGSISVRLCIDFKHAMSLEELCELSHYLENSKSFQSVTALKIKEIFHILKPAIEKPGFWDQYEDYLFFHFEKATKDISDLKSALYGDGISSLILGEKYMNFSEQINQSVASTTFQYEKNDLLLIHWNGAILFDPELDQNIIHSIEFALCQLLELRYYDNLLDLQLEQLYHRIENSGRPILTNPYRELSRQAALEYIDISEIVDKVGNAFKVIGDFYYATIFRAATERFQIPVWRKIVDHKLGNLAEVSTLFQGEINEKRNQLLEIIIIILIAIEVIPFVINLARN